MIEPFSYRTLLSPDFNLEDWKIFHQPFRVTIRAVQLRDMTRLLPGGGHRTTHAAREDLLWRHGLIHQISPEGFLSDQMTRQYWFGFPDLDEVNRSMGHWLTQHCIQLLAILDRLNQLKRRPEFALAGLQLETRAVMDVLKTEADPEMQNRYRKLFLTALI